MHTLKIIIIILRRIFGANIPHLYILYRHNTEIHIFVLYYACQKREGEKINKMRDSTPRSPSLSFLNKVEKTDNV